MNAVACGRDGCPGVLEEGYCSACGLAEVRAAIPPAAQQMQATRAEEAEGAERKAFVPMVRSAGARRPRSVEGRAGSRRLLGAGLVTVPELPSVAPEAAVLAEARVPDGKRFCAQCDSSLRREAGFCGKCGARYSFVATLQAGDVLADQYEVRGPLAFGGLGWIYLAFDRLLFRYVVLKGLLNVRDSSAAAIAVAERQFLASVKHPNIVGIYSFVQAAGEGFIVMEYVGGKTLKQIRKERGPLPPAEAAAYIHRILGAFAYLHHQGLVFCDFKPDNVMLEHDEVKLIDLGGVRRVDDPGGDIYGTVGYSAPEAGAGPTPASDLFTVGRTLAVLLMDIPAFGGEHRYRLPEQKNKAVLCRHEAMYRFLLKATAVQPEERFCSADEMAEQLLGVLREIVVDEGGPTHTMVSRVFGPDLLALETSDPMHPVAPSPQHLPVPSLDMGDAGAPAVTAALALPTLERKVAALRLGAQQLAESRELPLRLAFLLTRRGELDEAGQLLDGLERDDPWDWRVLWYRAHLCLARDEAAQACRLFDQVCFELPGELAPKLALGLAAETMGDWEWAGTMYERVSRVDPGFASAAFGLARCQRRRGDRGAAVEALSRVEASSSVYLRAQVETARTLLVQNGTRPGPDAIDRAASLAEVLPLDERDRHRLRRDVYRAALAEVSQAKAGKTPKLVLLGKPHSERDLREGLEQTLRAMARFADGRERLALLEEANRVRPLTLF